MRSDAYFAVNGLSKSFGGLRAVQDVTLQVARGEILGVIGANGAGKSTFLNLLTGFLRPDTGTVSYLGRDITREAPYRISRAGVARTFQDLRLFEALTVAENMLACTPEYRASGLLGAFRRRGRLDPEAAAKLTDVMAFLGLTELTDTVVADISYGEQKLVALGRVLAAEGDLILLDEPLAGLSEQMVERTTRIVAELAEDGRTVLLIDHNVDAVMRTVDRIVVFDHGAKIADGDAATVRRDERVQAAYLGV